MLGVCLGMQVLFEWSEEGDVEGLGILPGRSGACRPGVKVPHMGWNEVALDAAASRSPPAVPDGTRFYFVHSYVVRRRPRGSWRARPSTAIASPPRSPAGPLFATQFHPEKSGRLRASRSTARSSRGRP